MPRTDQDPSVALPFIDGKDIEDADRQEVRNPARRTEVVGHVASGTAGLVDAAVRAAQAAQHDWSRMSCADRADLLAEGADQIEELLADAAPGLTREHGKVLWEANKDISTAPRILRYYAREVREFSFESRERDERGLIIEHRRPFGVVGIIAPWNSPIPLCFLMTVPALVTGNTVVVKPAMEVPLTVVRALRVLASALPPGVLNIVLGGGAEAGQALVRHPGVRKISFTGSTLTGQAILVDCAHQIKNATMELGGNDAAVILPECPITDSLVDELIRGTFTTSGQVCYNVKRIYVHESAHDALVKRYTAAADEIVVGDGLESEVTIGPLATPAQFAKVNDLLEVTRISGATVTTVGRKHDPESWDGGHFIAPTVVTDIPQSAELVQTEQFGPVIPILRYGTEQQAIEMMNDTPFGLGGSLWTPEVDRALELANQIESGTVFVNLHRVGASDVSMPFGGIKESGMGRTHGRVAMEESCELQVFAHRPELSAFDAALSEGLHP